MTTRRTLIALAALAPAMALAQPAIPPAILAAEREWYDALVAASGPRLDRLIADDFAYQHPSGETYGKADFIALFTSGRVTVTELGAVERQVRDHGPTVIVYGANPIAGMLGGQPYAGLIRFVNVWRGGDGGWRLVHRNSQILPPR